MPYVFEDEPIQDASAADLTEIKPGTPARFENITPQDKAKVVAQLNVKPAGRYVFDDTPKWSGKAEDIKDVTTPSGYVGKDTFLDKIDPENYVGNSALATFARPALRMLHDAVPFPEAFKKETYKDPEGLWKIAGTPFPDAINKTVRMAGEALNYYFGPEAEKLLSDAMSMGPAFATSPFKGPGFMRGLSGETKIRADIASPEFQQELKAADILKDINAKAAAAEQAKAAGKAETEVSQFERFIDVQPGLRKAPEPAAPTQVGTVPSFRGNPPPPEVPQPANVLPNPPGRTGPFADIADAEREFADKQQAAKQVESAADWTSFLGEQFLKAKAEGVPIIEKLNQERDSIRFQATEARARLRSADTSQAEKQIIRSNLENLASRDAAIKNELANPTVTEDVTLPRGVGQGAGRGPGGKFVSRPNAPGGTMETARPQLGLPAPENGPQSLEVAGERTNGPFREGGEGPAGAPAPEPPKPGTPPPTPEVAAKIAANDAEIARLRAEIAKGQVTKPVEETPNVQRATQPEPPGSTQGALAPQEAQPTPEAQPAAKPVSPAPETEAPADVAMTKNAVEPKALSPEAADAESARVEAIRKGIKEYVPSPTDEYATPKERAALERRPYSPEAATPEQVDAEMARLKAQYEQARTQATNNPLAGRPPQMTREEFESLPESKRAQLRQEAQNKSSGLAEPSIEKSERSPFPGISTQAWSELSEAGKQKLISEAAPEDLIRRGFGRLIRNERGSLTGGKSDPVESQIAKSAREELYARIAEEARQTGESIADTATKLGVPADLLKNMQTTLAWTGKEGQKFNVTLNEPVIGDTGERPFKNSELVNKVANTLTDKTSAWNYNAKKTFAPELLPDGRLAAIEYAPNMTTAKLLETRAKVQLGQLRELFSRITDQGRRILNNYETGKLDQIPPSIRPFFEWYKNETDRVYKAMQEFGDPAKYIENWVGHLYKGDAAKNAAIIRDYYEQQKTLLGPERFLKQRQLPTYEVARHLGLEPKYENAADLMMAALNQEYKYVAMVNTIKTGLDDGSLVLLGKDMERLPGMDYLRDSKENPLTLDQRGQQSKFGEFRIIGHPDYVRILNNAVSPDIMPPGAKAVSYPMALFRKIKVAGSLFHPQFIVAADLAEGAGSVGEAIGSALIGDKEGFLRGLKESKRLIGQPWESYLKGSAVRDAIRRGDIDPAKNPDMEAFIMTGQRALTSHRYDPLKTDMDTKALLPLSQAIGESIKEISQGKEVMQNLGKILQGPVMDHFVGKTKTGAAVRMYWDGVERLAEEKGGIENVTIADKKALGFDIGNHLNDMMGMVPREQFYFKNGVKNWMSFLMNFPGWNIGSGRLLASGGKGVIGNALNIPAEMFSKSGRSFMELSGKEQLAAKAIAGTLVVHGIQSAMMNYFMTGEWPRDMKDFLAARTGKQDANGNDQRMWPVTYVNSWYSWMTHPIKAGINRGNFVGAEAYRLLANMDYWGNHMYTPGANWSKQALEMGVYEAKQALPFSINNIVALNAQGVYTNKDAALTVGGWKPSGRDLNDTPAENLAHEKFMSHLGANDPDEISLIRDRSLLSQMIKNKDPDAKTKAVEMLKQNRITIKEVENIYKGIGTRAFYHEVQSIANRGDMDGVFDIWDKAKVGNDPRDVNDIKQVLGTKLIGVLGHDDTPQRLSAMFKGRPFEQIGPELAKVRDILAFRHPRSIKNPSSESEAASE